MSQSLSRWQAILLGLVVVLSLAVGVFGIARIAHKQGLWAETFELTAGFPEVHDVTLGTPVRIRGLDAGQVVGIEYPEQDGPGAEVTLRLRLESRFANRLYADATAQIQTSGLLGSRVIAVHPGNPERGILTGGRLRGQKPFNLDEAVAEVRGTAAELRGLANEAKELVKDVRESNGTMMKLLRDDDLYQDAKALISRADHAIGTLEGEVSGLRGFVQDGRETLRSVRQGTDALGKMPIVRNYVENSVELLVRPNHHRTSWMYKTGDLFEPGTATLSYEGQVHLNNLTHSLKANGHKQADIVVAAFWDPSDKTQTPASALELTRRQAEAVIAHFKICNVHKIGTFSRRKLTPLGMGISPSPVVEVEPLPCCAIQVLLFTPY